MRATTVFNDLVGRVADRGRSLMGAGAPRNVAQMCDTLLTGKGEATGLALARAIFDRYGGMDWAAKQDFFTMLRDRFGVDRGRTETVLKQWQDGDETALRDLHTASEPRSQELIRRLNRAPGGTRRLVAMRDDLLHLMGEDPGLRALDADFRHLFTSWFNRGFLELQRIDWHTPANVLEKIIQYEAVHEISGWDDLRRRVAAPDRRLYAFFHPALGDDPLIFVEVALTADIPGAIGAILAADRPTMAPATARTAVFYSISNCQTGLRGISFGNFLIKQVVEELGREWPNLTTFVTLSPVPGLRNWALTHVDELPRPLADTVAAAEDGAHPVSLSDLAAHYMLATRHPRGGATDPVARFHLGNGARLERINRDADASPNGQAASWGVMVNYLYDLDTIERNHEAYSTQGEIIAAPPVRRLLKTR
ncbi:malonyl-CoA decarboxylase [Loktanella sp. DJP18]|uniref:malonyl-CoA decarboxylase n=1 Tax=Loktanella sp. DJP18 TaxID=3409788 RepID=UPI003BB80951